jgi:hypothetical protein
MVFHFDFSRNKRDVIPPIVRRDMVITMVSPKAACKPGFRFQPLLLNVTIAMVKVARKIKKPVILWAHIENLWYILSHLAAAI